MFLNLNKLKNYTIGVLLAVMGLMYVYIQIQEHGRQKDMDKIGYLDGNLNRLVDMVGPLLIDKYRTKTGEVRVKTTYIPPEAKVSILIPEENGEPVRVVVKNKGFVVKPGFGIALNPQRKVKENLVLSTKFFYWGRYGVVVNGSLGGLSLGLSRHLDDAFIFWKPTNLELFVAHRVIEFDRDSTRWIVGTRISF